MRSALLGVGLAVLAAITSADAGQVFNLPGTVCEALTVNTTSVGNVGAGEDDLMTYALPANALSANGAFVQILVWGTAAANVNSKNVKVYFGSTNLSSEVSTSTTASGQSWSYEATVVRTGAATQEAIIFGRSEDTGRVSSRTAPAETLSGAVTIKATGEATSDNDIVQRGMIVTVCNR